MTVTFVTAFIRPRTSYRSLEAYVDHFRTFASSGVPICLFLDPEVSIEGLPPTVQSIPWTVDVSWIPADVQLPPTRTLTKDTCEYFAIQLEKLRVLRDATAYTHSSHLAWLDFGAFHMMRDIPRTLDCLRMIARSTFPSTRILAPGCWPPGQYDWSAVCWRFCGTFLLGHRSLFDRAVQAQQALVEAQLPRLTWEINYWAQMEEHFEVYRASHDDTLLSRVTVFVQRHHGVSTDSSCPSDTQPSITDRTAS